MFACTCIRDGEERRRRGRSLNVASSVGTGHLGPDDLVDVLNAIYTASHKWFPIGVQLGISVQTLSVIRREHHDNATDCLTEMLQRWLTSISSLPTWSGLVQALSSAPVGEKRLAEEIRERYCHQDGEQATGPAAGEWKGRKMWRENGGQGRTDGDMKKGRRKGEGEEEGRGGGGRERGRRKGKGKEEGRGEGGIEGKGWEKGSEGGAEVGRYGRGMCTTTV